MSWQTLHKRLTLVRDKINESIQTATNIKTDWVQNVSFKMLSRKSDFFFFFFSLFFLRRCR